MVGGALVSTATAFGGAGVVTELAECAGAVSGKGAVVATTSGPGSEAAGPTSLPQEKSNKSRGRKDSLFITGKGNDG